MTTVTGVRTVALYVADVAAARHFYADLLGVPVEEERHGRVQMNVGGIRLLIHPTDTDSKDRAEARHGRTEIYFEVSDVDGAVRTLRAAGIEVVQEPTDQPWGERDAAVVDPEGFSVFLTQVKG